MAEIIDYIFKAGLLCLFPSTAWYLARKLPSKEDIIGLRNELREEIKEIREGVIASKRTLIAENSPLALTKEGKEMAQKLSSRTLIDKHWEKILPVIKAELKEDTTNNPHDVEDACFETGRKYASLFEPEEVQ